MISTAIGAAVLWILFRWSKLEPADLWSSWKRLSLGAALSAFAVHVAIYVVRSQRFRVLLPVAHRPSSAAMLAISAAHNLAAYVLPAKTGEMTLVMYLRSHSGVPAAQGLAALLVSRLLDLATLCLLLALAMIYLVTSRPDSTPVWFWAFAVALLATAAFLMLLSARSDVLVRSAAWIARVFGLASWNIGLRMLARAEELSLALRQAPAGRVLWIAAAQSMAMWFGIFIFYSILARSFGLPPELGLADAAFGSSLVVLSNLLPINSFAGFGTQEGGWVLGFGLLGVPRDLALSTGFGVHLAQLASTIVLGICGHVAMGWLPGRAAAVGANADTPGNGLG
ncbi:MAG TPA: lysylphosphatidylglycerol synthase transmembrane domain-containing protein [Planctomycetota bacterium]|nr:lysylphosphatidylglycerol synthase transmembrane domain-containing protein [Planctomycetota bacterium]